MEALKLEGITKTFRDGKREIRAVDGVGFSVGEGEIFGLLGMNGAGKSTTIKVCTGLVTPDSGTACVFGHDIVKEREKAKSLLNVSPQETAVAPLLSVRENLIFVARIYGADKKEAEARADEIMASLKLADRASDKASKLSGGLMRRLSIGMALITSPRLVFLDEPTLGLDVVSRRELWRHIREISKTSAVVLTTHYLEEAQALCNRIAVMTGGKIAAIGTADELIEQSGESNFENAFLRLSGEGAYIDE
ncbi:MAG: ABC transporter ATP-binding protein [Roseburia sp.]|nr:ABC transporter ATP-binding protein [Roseburia sp.]